VLPDTVSTKTVTVELPYPVPCVTPADIPKLPVPTPLVADATAEQKAAAVVADAEALARYADEVSVLFIRCTKIGDSPP
jgi:hypothetical protein